MENELNITPFTRTPWRWSEAPGIDLGPDPSPWLSNETGPGVWPGQGCSGGDLDVKPWAGPKFPERSARESAGDLWTSAPDTARKPGSLSRWLGLPAVLGLAATLAVPAVTSAAEVSRRPNIVILLCDDMGFSDMGAFGSEIRTPNMDALAKDGVRFVNFYTHATSSPTRSVFLTGVDTHLNGLGNMSEWTAPNQIGLDGYEGNLNDRIVTLPQLLKDAGYHTYMVGKWHLGKEPTQIPAARGFERDFTLLDGMGSYWDDWSFAVANPKSLYTEDGRYLTRLPKGFYATETYTDKMISYIDAGRADGKPFFAYVSHQAPHEPYHLPRAWRNRHVGEYDKGWDALRAERLKRQIELGIMPAGTQLAERMWFVPDSTLLAPGARAYFGKKMEIYAGLVENLDYHIGRLVDHLKKIGEYENTIFIMFGDNGAEGGDLFGLIAGAAGSRDNLWAAMHWSQTDPNAWGDPGSWLAYGPMWAQVSMTPFSQYKAWLAEGGIRNGLVVSGPVVKRPKGSISNGLMHVADLMPTLLEVAGTSYPKSYKGKDVPPALGKSWVPVLEGRAESPRTDQDVLAWELFGNRAVRQGNWKLRWQTKPFGKADWELFDVAADPCELKDLAADRPDKLREMVALWDDYVLRSNVVLPNRTPYEALEKALPQRVPVQPGYPPANLKRQYVPPKDMMAEPKKLEK